MIQRATDRIAMQVTKQHILEDLWMPENSVEIYRSSLGGVRSAICEPSKNFCSARPLMRPLKA
jgi:hypothetical protein